MKRLELKQFKANQAYVFDHRIRKYVKVRTEKKLVNLL